MRSHEAPAASDVDLHDRTRRGAMSERPAATLLAISAGGVVGALARYGLGELITHRTDEWPWATWLVNASGCLLLGVLMALITEVWPGRPLLRPFLGVGVLGGYTTFSTAMVEVQQLVQAGKPGTGLLYLVVTLFAALVAVTAGWVGATALVRKGRQR